MEENCAWPNEYRQLLVKGGGYHELAHLIRTLKNFRNEPYTEKTINNFPEYIDRGSRPRYISL